MNKRAEIKFTAPGTKPPVNDFQKCRKMLVILRKKIFTAQRAMIGIGFLLSQLICASLFSESPDIRTPLVSKQAVMEVGPTSAPPVIDGNLDDKCWRTSSIVSGFITVDTMWATEQTTAYVTYDDAYLYLAFHCNDSMPENIIAETKKNDDLSIFGDDTIEIFLDTNHDRKTYYHFAINPIGTRYEASCDANQKETGFELRDDNWNPEWEFKTKVSAQFWTAEMRIPFASLGVPCPPPGTKWGINLGRSCRSTGKGVEYTSWAMITGNFNQPMNFGELVFGDYPDVSYSVISMKNYLTDNELKIRFRNGKESLLTLRARWTVGASSKVATVRLRPKEEKEIYLVSKKDTSSNTGAVTDLAFIVANAQTGKIYDFRKTGWKPSPPIEMSLDRYYYTPDIQQVRVGFTRFSEKINNGDFLKVTVGKNPSEKPVVSQQISLVPGKDDYNASFDIAGWSVGRYVVSARLQDKRGKTLSSVYRVFIKKKIEPAKIPAPAPKVSLRSDGIILLDEKPFFPFFASTEQSQSALANDCFNVEYGGLGLISRPLKRGSIGLPKYTQEQGFNNNELFMLLPEEKQMLADIRNVITAQKTDPLLLYWNMSYEANIPMYRGKKNRVRLNNAEEFKKISRFVKSIDPNHPTALEIDSGNWAEYKDSADIIEIASWNSSYAKNLIPNFIKDADEVRGALGQGKPFIFWIGSSIPTAEQRTAEDIRCASYLALMHGAAGIIFHMGHAGISPVMTRHWSVYTGLSREIEELFPILTTLRQTDGKYKIAVNSAGIDYCAREYNNRLYLIAVNTLNTLVNAKISIADSSTLSKRVNVLFENREIKLSGNSFADVFTAFEPHVYEFVLVKGSE